jgi:hypothetical protein
MCRAGVGVMVKFPVYDIRKIGGEEKELKK